MDCPRPWQIKKANMLLNRARTIIGREWGLIRKKLCGVLTSNSNGIKSSKVGHLVLTKGGIRFFNDFNQSFLVLKNYYTYISYLRVFTQQMK